MKLPQFDGKNMAVKTSIDKMLGYKVVNGWSEEASLIHLMNQIQDPASIVVWSLERKANSYSFDNVCRTLETAYGSSGSKENLRAELSSCKRKKYQSILELGSAIQRMMCLIYPEMWTDATEEIGMRAFFDALEDVEIVTQFFRYQAPKTLQAAIFTVQMVESCRLAVGATARVVRSAHVHMMNVPGPLEVDDTPLTLNAVVKAFHTARASPPSTPAVPATSMPKGVGKDPGGDRKQIKNLQGA